MVLNNKTVIAGNTKIIKSLSLSPCVALQLFGILSKTCCIICMCRCEISDIVNKLKLRKFIVHLFSLDIVFEHFTIHIIHACTRRQNENKIIQSVIRWKVEYTKAARLRIVLT